MSAGNIQNDFPLLPMDSPKRHHISLSELSVQNLTAQCMMKLGYYPLKS